MIASARCPTPALPRSAFQHPPRGDRAAVFSNFSPSMIGGDVARVVMSSRETGSGSRAAASVLIERFTGLATMIAASAIVGAQPRARVCSNTPSSRPA